MLHLIEFGEGRHRVYLDLIKVGRDLVIYIGGGEEPHIGAVSICSQSGEPLTFSLPNHKDYIVSHNAAKKIFNETGRKTVVIAGIHVNNASKEDILQLLKNAEECVLKFKDELVKASITK
ncbi:MAG: hypothetical protein N3D12_03365 [Candidatus Methanomethyliaceae archaeon]|nr:hypothetical protein [Candidatus Methanomethyliaceae archaeon]